MMCFVCIKKDLIYQAYFKCLRCELKSFVGHLYPKANRGFSIF